MIVSNRSRWFSHGYVGTIDFGTPERPAHGCIVSASPEGRFKEWAIIIQYFEGKRSRPTRQHIAAKANLHPDLSDRTREEVYSKILRHLDSIANSGLRLEAAIREVLEAARNKNELLDWQIILPAL